MSVVYLLILTFEITAVFTVFCTLTVCVVIALLTAWESIMHGIREEIRTADIEDGEEAENVYRG